METEHADFNEELIVPPNAIQGDLNRLQKKIAKYLLGIGQSDSTGLRRAALYGMMKAGVMDRGISYDETKERLEMYYEENSEHWCSDGVYRFNWSVKSEAKKTAERAEREQMQAERAAMRRVGEERARQWEERIRRALYSYSDPANCNCGSCLLGRYLRDTNRDEGLVPPQDRVAL